LYGKLEGYKQLGRSSYRREDNFKMDLRETEMEGGECVE
jgi:hypothetical protein